jgi:hypothetical protein
MLGHKIIWSRKCGLSVGIKPWDPQDHGIKSGLRGTFHESGINSQIKDIGFQISSTESRIKCQPHPLVWYILQFSSPNAGAQNNLIPKIWPSLPFDPRMVRIEALDSLDHGNKSGLRDTLIFPCWGSKHSDRASLAFASCWSSICGIKPWDPQDHGIKCGLRGAFHVSGIHSPNKDIGFQISSTESGIKSQANPLVLYIP